ncbi:MAG TPA: hypothetical protein VIL78_00690 [Hanamia sp.]
MFFLNKIVNGGFVDGAKKVIHGVTKVAISVGGNAVGGIFGDAHLGGDLVSSADYAAATTPTGAAPVSHSLSYLTTGVPNNGAPVTILGLPGNMLLLIAGALLLMFLLLKPSKNGFRRY